VKLHYTGNGKPHTMTIPILYSGTPSLGTTPLVINKALETVAGDVAMTQFVDNFLPCYHTTDGAQSYEFWYKPTVDADPVYIKGVTLAGAVGISSFPAISMSECILSFRTLSGNLAKVYLMESVAGGIGKLQPPSYNGAAYLASLASFLVSDDAIWVGRDGAFLQTCIQASVKYSDALYKKYFG
jgi:hypothetical protein